MEAIKNILKLVRKSLTKNAEPKKVPVIAVIEQPSDPLPKSQPTIMIDELKVPPIHLKSVPKKTPKKAFSGPFGVSEGIQQKPLRGRVLNTCVEKKKPVVKMDRQLEEAKRSADVYMKAAMTSANDLMKKAKMDARKQMAKSKGLNIEKVSKK